MEPTYFAQYRGFDFQCSPERLGARAFAPRLVIYHASESITVEIPFAIPTPPLEDATAAAHKAFAFGRSWVDSGFDPAHFANGGAPALRLTSEVATN